MELSGTPVQNNESSGSPLVLNGKNPNVQTYLRRSKLRREAKYILLLFLLLFIALFVIMTTLYAIEKRKQLDETNMKKLQVQLETPRPTTSAPKVCTSVDCVLTITGQLDEFGLF